jgi:hypothetical protein
MYICTGPMFYTYICVADAEHILIQIYVGPSIRTLDICIYIYVYAGACLRCMYICVLAIHAARIYVYMYSMDHP